MASSTSLRSTRSPSSLRASRVKMTTRSRGTCSTASRRAPDRCLRSSMQNMGARRDFPGKGGELRPGMGGIGGEEQLHVALFGAAYR